MVNCYMLIDNLCIELLYLIVTILKVMFIFFHLHIASAKTCGLLCSSADYLVTKCGVLMMSLFVFFTTTMSVSFTLRETQTRMLKFTGFLCFIDAIYSNITPCPPSLKQRSLLLMGYF